MKKTVKISKLREWDKNPRGIKKKDFERLKKQITKLGQYKPLLITPDGEVLGGNMRLKAYRELGMKDIWVSVVTPKDENEKLEYALSDNDRAGYYDPDMLANLVPQFDIDWSNYAVDLKPPITLEGLVNPDVEEDEAPEIDPKAVSSKLGEIYQLGRHRLMCGDSTVAKDVEKLMNGQKADMVFTDPPYGIGLDIIGDDVTLAELVSFNFTWLKILYEVVNDNVVLLIFSSPRTFVSVLDEARRIGFEFLRYLTLYKQNDMPHTWQGFLMVSESILLFQKGKGEFTKIKPYLHDTILINYDGESGRDKKESGHPTMKKKSTCVDLIKRLKGEVVLDIFGGSGTTLIACEQTNRTCYMMEIDPKYCDVIRKRYANFIEKGDQWQKETPSL